MSFITRLLGIEDRLNRLEERQRWDHDKLNNFVVYQHNEGITLHEVVRAIVHYLNVEVACVPPTPHKVVLVMKLGEEKSNGGKR